MAYKKIHTRNLISKKNSCGSKIPLPPPITTFPNVGSLWIVVDRVVDRCGSLWIVVGHCGSLWIVPGFSNYDFRHFLGPTSIMRLLHHDYFTDMHHHSPY